MSSPPPSTKRDEEHEKLTGEMYAMVSVLTAMYATEGKTLRATQLLAGLMNVAAVVIQAAPREAQEEFVCEAARAFFRYCGVEAELYQMPEKGKLN